MPSSLCPPNGGTILVPESIIELADWGKDGVVCNLRYCQEFPPPICDEERRKWDLEVLHRFLDPTKMDLCSDGMAEFIKGVEPRTKLALFMQCLDGRTVTMIVQIRQIELRGYNILLDFPRPRLWQKMFGVWSNMWCSFVLAAAIVPKNTPNTAVEDLDGTEFVRLFA